MGRGIRRLAVSREHSFGKTANVLCAETREVAAQEAPDVSFSILEAALDDARPIFPRRFSRAYGPVGLERAHIDAIGLNQSLPCSVGKAPAGRDRGLEAGFDFDDGERDTSALNEVNDDLERLRRVSRDDPLYDVDMKLLRGVEGSTGSVGLARGVIESHEQESAVLVPEPDACPGNLSLPLGRPRIKPALQLDIQRFAGVVGEALDVLLASRHAHPPGARALPLGRSG